MRAPLVTRNKARQFRLRRKSSTGTVSAQFIDQLFMGVDSGSTTGAVFLDLTKAFDTVNHSSSNRSQVTYSGNAQSDKAALSVGVAQGSILGPLVFIIYMNNLPNVLELEIRPQSGRN